jgi:fructoselysine 6-kinase
MKSLVTVGDNCIDVYPALGRGFPGGNAVNVAVHSARHGLSPAYVGWVGEDEYGRQLRRELAAAGVDVSYLHSKTGVTAQTFVALCGSDRVLGDYVEGVMSNFCLTDEDLTWIEQFDMLHAGIWGHVEPYLPALKAPHRIMSFDFADKWDSPLWSELAPSLDYAFASAREDTPALRSHLREIVHSGAGSVIATLGAEGSLAYDGQSFYRQCAIAVDIVDTMGAGDAFIAGFLSAIARHFTVEQAMLQGAQGAASTLQCHGAWG